MSRLLVNRWRCPDGTILQSKHRHDFVQHEKYFVDGGLDCPRTSIELESLCLFGNDPHEEIRKYFMWGSRGLKGNEALKWTALENLEEEHIWSIIRTQGDYLKKHIFDVFHNELKFRGR